MEIVFICSCSATRDWTQADKNALAFLGKTISQFPGAVYRLKHQGECHGRVTITGSADGSPRAVAIGTVWRRPLAGVPPLMKSASRQFRPPAFVSGSIEEASAHIDLDIVMPPGYDRPLVNAVLLLHGSSAPEQRQRAIRRAARSNMRPRRSFKLGNKSGTEKCPMT